MLAESLGMYNDTTVPGGNALTKEDDDWDIWSNDGEE